MHDRQVRRRRLVLAIFVVLSLGLLTIYFGESSGGGLHSLQRGALGVLGPVQEGASRALKPFRDLFGWVDDTLDAKSERSKLTNANADLKRQVYALQAQAGENRSLKRLLQINDAGGLDKYVPKKARVTGRYSNLFYSTVNIDKGTSSGVRVGQPVVNGSGLVGRVSGASAGYSVVTLVTDDEFAAGARTLSSDQVATVEASPDRVGDLELKLPRNPDKVNKGERVVTSGSISTKLDSYFPPNIPIGRVSRIDYGDGDLDQVIHVTPAVDLNKLLYVEALTRSDAAPAIASTNVP